MEVKAIAKYVRVQPRKVRIIADEVRGKNAEHAAHLLRYHTGKGAKALRKVLINAMANAQENNNLAPEVLKIATITVDEGPRLKRMQAKAMGRGARIFKRTSHITVIVDDTAVNVVVKPHGTKAKARPTFAALAKGKKAAAKPKKDEAVEQPVDEVTEPVAAAEPEAAVEAQAEEATPVEASEAPEEAGSAEPEASADETTSSADKKGADKE